MGPGETQLAGEGCAGADRRRCPAWAHHGQNTVKKDEYNKLTLWGEEKKNSGTCFFVMKH